MAVSSSSYWFQDWITPDHVYSTLHNIDHSVDKFWKKDENFGKSEKYGKSLTNPAQYLPYVLSLGLVQPNENSQNYQESREPKEKLSYETSGPFITWYSWKEIDFAYPSEAEKTRALSSGDFIPDNNLPLGIEVYSERLFVSFPKWKTGVPATLTVIPRRPEEKSPKFVPYPNWEIQKTDDCSGLTSVYRMEADDCGRLWVLDSGQVEVTIKSKQICPPQLFIFDLNTDELLLRYPLPEEFIKQDSLYTNIKIDVRDHKCEDAHAYMTDVWRFGLVVFSLAQMKSWRVTDHLFYPDPLAAAYHLHGLDFEWTDGIFGLALSPVNEKTNDRILYFHPMSSFREFYVKASVIRNETGWSDVKDAFKIIGEPRGKSGHASASAMDRNGVLIYNEVTRDSVGCWDSRKPYLRDNLGLLARDNVTMVFPNDMKIDKEARQSVWVISNRLPFYLYSSLDKNKDNFRIMSAFIDEATRGTVCDPNVISGSYAKFNDYHGCY